MTRGLEGACWGAATRDGEVRLSKAGNAFGVVNIMVQDGSVGDDGKPSSTFLKILAFGPHVEVARTIRKGDRVYTEGSFQPRSGARPMAGRASI